MPEENNHHKYQNLIALTVLLGGLFVGSLFVDIIQLIDGSGFSQHALKNVSVLESAGRTWVAYTEPKIKLEVVNDKTCLTCNTEEALRWIQRLVPTVHIVEIDASSSLGTKRINDFGLTVLPAFVFSKEITKTSFYEETKELFQPVDGLYNFSMERIGFAGGKYLNPPTTETNDIIVGDIDAPVKIVVYTDFQCEYCRDFHSTLNKAIDAYGDDISVTYRHFPLSFHKQAPLAALASQCAFAQDKFPLYADELFSSQEKWGETTGTSWFSTAALRLKLNQREFNRCLQNKTYAEKIASDAFSAQEFGISGTPSTFVNTKLISGAVDYATLESVINNALGK